MNTTDLIEVLAERQWRRMTRSTTPYAELSEHDKRSCRALVVPVLADIREVAGPDMQAPTSVTWSMPLQDARDLLGWLRHNHPLGMPDDVLDGLLNAIAAAPATATEADENQGAV